MDKEHRREYNKRYRTEVVICPHCKKKVKRGQLTRHRGSRKCKNSYDKTNPLEKTIPATSPQGLPLPEAGLELQSKKLININLKGEYDKMTEVLNPKKQKNDGKEKKYQCSECGATFDNLKDNTDCPDCGVKLK